MSQELSYQILNCNRSMYVTLWVYCIDLTTINCMVSNQILPCLFCKSSYLHQCNHIWQQTCSQWLDCHPFPHTIALQHKYRLKMMHSFQMQTQVRYRNSHITNHFLSYNNNADTCQPEHFPPEPLFWPLFLSFHAFSKLFLSAWPWWTSCHLQH